MRYLPAMRHLIGADQSTVANECGLSIATVANAEKGRGSDKTVRALLSLYAAKGCQLAPLPGGVVAIVWTNDAPSYAAAVDCIAPRSASRNKNGSGTKSRVLPPSSKIG